MHKENKVLFYSGVAVVVLIAMNLRSPITAVSPVLDEIKSALGLNNTQASLLTSIPLLMFAGFSILVSKATSRVDIRKGLIYSLIILAVGLYIRVYGTISSLYIGSFLLGLGICIGNVLTPAYIKKIFPQQVGIMTGIFSVSMNLVAALATGFSIAIGQWTNAGWRGSLGIWILGAMLAFLMLLIDVRLGNQQTNGAQSSKPEHVSFNIFLSRQAWYISVFMGIQSLIYYCLVAFLPTLLIDYGMSKYDAGWVFSILQLAMLPVMLFSPVIASKMKDPKALIFSSGGLYFIGIGMLLLFKAQYVYLTAVLLGVAGGLAFSLAILFFSLRSKTMQGTILISGKAQSVGYLLAAFGPPIFSKLHDWDFSWTYSLYFILACILLMTYFGRKAAKPRFIEDH